MNRLLLCFLLIGDHGLLMAASAAPEAARLDLSRDATRKELFPPDGRSEAEGLPPYAIPKLSGDQEFGEQLVLARRANWEPWTVSAGAEYYFTDNAALSSKGELRDCYLRSGMEARYANRFSGNWFINAALDGHAYFYERYDALDFLLVKADVSVMYKAPWLADAFLSAGYAAYWISGSDFTTEAFRNQAVVLGAQKTWKIARAMQVVAGASAEYSFQAEPRSPQRNEYSSYLAYKLRVTEKLTVTASYRLAWYEYPSLDRHDWNHVFLIEGSYDLTDWAKLSLSASNAWNLSDIPSFNYRNLVGGVSANLTLAF